MLISEMLTNTVSVWRTLSLRFTPEVCRSTSPVPGVDPDRMLLCRRDNACPSLPWLAIWSLRVLSREDITSDSRFTWISILSLHSFRAKANVQRLSTMQPLFPFFTGDVFFSFTPLFKTCSKGFRHIHHSTFFSFIPQLMWDHLPQIRN